MSTKSFVTASTSVDSAVSQPLTAATVDSTDATEPLTPLTPDGSIDSGSGMVALAPRKVPSTRESRGFLSGVMKMVSGKGNESALQMRNGAVIMWDWDDTLAPTTWIQDVVMPRGQDSHFSDAFAKQVRLINEALLASHAVARVVIVTLASERWVKMCMDSYLVGVEDTISRLGIPILYASRTCLVSEIDSATASKRSTMRDCLRWLYPDASTHKNVLSIGDMSAEAEALRYCLSDCKSSSYCKTIKLRERPTLGDLQSELNLLIPSLPGLVAQKSGFDKTTEGMMFKAMPQLRRASI